MNWYIIVLLAIGAIFLIVFLIKRNLQDEKDFEKFSNNDYPQKPEDDFDGN